MKIPFSFVPEMKLESLAKNFLGFGEAINPLFPFLELNLKQSKSKYTAVQYLSMCAVASSVFSVVAFLFLLLVTYLVDIDSFIIMSVLITIPVTIFVFIEQAFYPRLYASRNIREIERNLLPSLRAILIHLSSGVSLYEVFIAISNGPYGELSTEFKTIVRKINAGTPAIDALEESATKNPSVYYRRAIWQMVNGMKAGGDVTLILKEVIDGLSKEQVIQIENYGSQLNPLAMFYMLIAVVMPSLAITLLVVIASFLAVSGFTLKMIFFGLYLMILFFQIMFLGLIRSRRPNLIGT